MVMPSPSRATKTAGKLRTPTKRPQKHGGALLSGGKPGNKGGTGRPPESLRMESRELYALWLAWAKAEVAKGGLDTAAMNVIGNTAAKYGLGTTTDNTHRISRADLEKLTDAELEALASQ